MITDATARIVRTAALSRAAAMAKYAEEDLTEAAAALYADVVATRGAELKRALIVQASSISYAHLDEFDWSLRVAMSSSSLSSMRKPILLLKLSLKRPGGEVESHVVELPKDALDGLIASMEGANKVRNWGLGSVFVRRRAPEGAGGQGGQVYVWREGVRRFCVYANLLGGACVYWVYSQVCVCVCVSNV